MPRYAVPPVNAPYLKKGKRYKIIKREDDLSFEIVSDNGVKLFCLVSGCGHINGEDWIIDDVDDVDHFPLIRQWANCRNLIDGATREGQFEKLLEETTELYSGLRKNDQAEIIDAIGDCVVVLTILAEQSGVTIEECIASAYDQIKDRKGKMINGIFVKDAA